MLAEGRHDGERVVLGWFRVDDRLYALDAGQLREVVRWQPVTPLPRAPRLIEGVIDLRGSVVPIVDLGRALGGDPVCEGERARVAVAEVDGLLVGFAVDVALEVAAVDVSWLEDPPALASVAGDDAVCAVLRRPDAPPVPVLSLESLLERVARSALPEEEAV